MIKLLDILEEVKVNIPKTKKQVFEDAMHIGAYLYSLIKAKNLQSFLDGWGYDTLEEMIEELWEDDPNNNKEAILNYFKYIGSDDVKLIDKFPEGIKEYQNIYKLEKWVEDDEMVVVVTKF